MTNANKGLTTDDFIDEINRQTDAFAIKSKVYGIVIYETYQDFLDDDREVNWLMTVDPKATGTAQPFGTNFTHRPEEWSDFQWEQLTDIIDEYIHTPVKFRSTYVDRDDMEGIRKRLRSYFGDFNYGEEYRNGRLDGVLGVLHDLGLEKEYYTAKKSYRDEKLKAVNE